MTKKVPMTVEGAKRLKAELHHLKTVDRPAVISAIAEATTTPRRSGRGSSKGASRKSSGASRMRK